MVDDGCRNRVYTLTGCACGGCFGTNERTTGVVSAAQVELASQQTIRLITNRMLSHFHHTHSDTLTHTHIRTSRRMEQASKQKTYVCSMHRCRINCSPPRPPLLPTLRLACDSRQMSHVFTTKLLYRHLHQPEKNHHSYRSLAAARLRSIRKIE